ncbi:UNVERIFIED_CONTAM: hypothetical protein Slati_1967000 [Sesamum latifolium]|uniref:Serine aminopeptidase S33 domain-containing protein n=1 Tax=Sesamum latifolium TaxID=2727402 RepID=A0AAW2WM34_9LAMI
MAHHPIHEANENSPYGNLTKEEFYQKHHIFHQETFMLNKHTMKIFTQSWQPAGSNSQLKGVVCMIHGYTSESGWLFELSAVATAKAGFFVCSLDLQGHGFSEGPRDHITDVQSLVCDCLQYFDSARARHPNLPHFLYGESLGAAIAILICLHQKTAWKGYRSRGHRRADPTGELEEKAGGKEPESADQREANCSDGIAAAESV